MRNVSNSSNLHEEALYVDERVAAKIVAISLSKLQKLRHAGDGPEYSRVGRLVRYSRAALVEFMESRRVRRDLTKGGGND